MNNILDHFEPDEEQEEEWREFVGPEAAYYIRQWQQVNQGQVFTFNFSAFILGILWLLYRKMYRTGVLYLSVYLAEGFVEKMIFQGLGLDPSLYWWFGGRTLLFAGLLGFAGNWLYLIHTQDQIARIKGQYPPPQRREQLRRRGGVSLLPAVLFLCLILIILAGIMGVLPKI